MNVAAPLLEDRSSESASGESSDVSASGDGRTTEARGPCVSRRQLMAWAGGAVAAQSFSTSWTFALSSGTIVQRPASPSADWKPVLFNKKQALAVARIAEAIIPRTDTAGAIDAKVPEYIDLALSLESKSTQTSFLDNLKALDSVCRATIRSPLQKISDEQLQQLLARVSDSHEDHSEDLRPAARLFKDLKERTIFGYYTSLEGRTEELGLPAKVQRVDLGGCSLRASNREG